MNDRDHKGIWFWLSTLVALIGAYAVALIIALILVLIFLATSITILSYFDPT